MTEESKIAGLLAKKVSGEISGEESAALENWISRSASNRHIHDSVMSEDLLQGYKADASGIDKDKEIRAIRQKIESRRRRRRAISWGISAAAVIAAVGIFIAWPHPEGAPADIEPVYGKNVAIVTVGESEPVLIEGADDERKWRNAVGTTPAGGEQESAQPQDVKIEIPRGSEYRFRLDDGTAVWLNSESTLEYPVFFAGEKREVTLAGEAYFEVARDVSKPFVVRAHNTEIVVLGTSFNVSAYLMDNAVTATLVSGSVEVAAAGSRVELIAGRQAIVSKATGDITVKEVDTGQYTSWTAGRFEFDGMPLSEICAQLSRWYDVEFIFEGGSGSERFAGAATKNEPLGDFLRKIERVTDVSFIGGDGVIMVRRGH